MRTEKEILKKLDTVKNGDSVYLLNGDPDVQRDIITSLLKWVLETPSYRRTIFDLSENELIELAKLSLGRQFIYKHPIESFKLNEKTSSDVSLEIVGNYYNNNTYIIKFIIDKYLNIYQYYSKPKRCHMMQFFQLNTLNKLQEMLREELEK